MNVTNAFLRPLTFAVAVASASSASAYACMLEFSDGQSIAIQGGTCLYLGTEAEMIATDGCTFHLNPEMQFAAGANPEYAGKLTLVHGISGMMMAIPQNRALYTFQTGVGHELTPEERASAKSIFCYR